MNDNLRELPQRQPDGRRFSRASRPDDGKGGRGAHQVIPAGAHGRRYRMPVQDDLCSLPGLRKPVFTVGIAADQAVMERGLNTCMKREGKPHILDPKQDPLPFFRPHFWNQPAVISRKGNGMASVQSLHILFFRKSAYIGIIFIPIIPAVPCRHNIVFIQEPCIILSGVTRNIRKIKIPDFLHPYHLR